MPQMMMNLLQYVPYALSIAFSLSLLGSGAIYALLFFRKANQGNAGATISRRS